MHRSPFVRRAIPARVALVPATVLLAAWLGAQAVAPVEARAAERVVEGIAAQVGNDIVLRSEVLELAAPIEERMRAAGAPEAEITMMRRDALERLIESKLLSSVVERLELSADREEVDNAIAAIASDNGLSIEQLLASVTSHGLTVQEYRAKIRGEIERSKVVNAMVRSRVQIEEEEVRALYQERFGEQRSGGQEIYLRHLMVAVGGRAASTPGEACSLVRAARQEISTGERDFATLAQQISDSNPQSGGDLGWMHREELADWIGDVVDPMGPGELSSVVEMGPGCHLFEVVDRREFKPVTFEQAAPQLRNMIFQRKTEEKYTEWLDELREMTYIERKDAFGS